MAKDLPLSWQDVHILAKKLTSRIKESGQEWDRVIAITRGGLVPACLVARDLDIRVIETVCVESYAHQDQSEAKILYEPSNLGTGKGCLFVDDLSDTGNTFKALRKHYPEANFVCLHVKPVGKPLADFYAEEVSQDTWIYLPWEDQDFPPHIMDKIGSHL